jgi:hypothetical protein
MVLQVKELAGLINPSLPLTGNILNRVVLYILYICIVRQMAGAASQPFQTQPMCPLIVRKILWYFKLKNLRGL